MKVNRGFALVSESCGGGSIIDFVMKKEQLSFYKAALKIWQTFFSISKKKLRSNADSLINIEIDIEVHHPYLIRRGIDEKLASFFRIRYDSYGRMRDRIVFPIMDRYKKQVGCRGRVVHRKVWLNKWNKMDCHLKLFSCQTTWSRRHWGMMNYQDTSGKVIKPILMADGE